MTSQDVFHQAPTGENLKRRPPPHIPLAIVLSQYATQETFPFTSRDPPQLLLRQRAVRIISRCGTGVLTLEGRFEREILTLAPQSWLLEMQDLRFVLCEILRNSKYSHYR